jgi:beta-N-acetylhexosaminidase
VASMDDETVAGQLLLTGVDGSSRLSGRSLELLSQTGIGGVMFFKYNLGHGAAAARKLADECVAAGAVLGDGRRILPFIAVDHEGGDVHRFGQDATHLPSAASFGALAAKGGMKAAAETVRGAAYRSALELRALGITLNLAPIAEAADVHSSVFLGDRSYGSEEGVVAAAAAAFVQGMDDAGVACAVKHFPGNAAADPHRAAPVIPFDRAALDRMTAPFKDVIGSARPAAVMVSHAVVTALDPDRPGSLSRAVVTDWLKRDFGFKGFVVTDDLRMKAVAAGGRTPAKAAVEAVAAGADLVMTWPVDLVAVRSALAAAVERGELPRERLRDAARRVIAAKLRYGLCPRSEDDDSGDANSGDAIQKDRDITETLARFREETERYLRERGLR